jgi:hypothetical protein
MIILQESDKNLRYQEVTGLVDPIKRGAIAKKLISKTDSELQSIPVRNGSPEDQDYVLLFCDVMAEMAVRLYTLSKYNPNKDSKIVKMMNKMSTEMWSYSDKKNKRTFSFIVHN